VAGDIEDEMEEFANTFTQSLEWPEKDGEEMVKVEWEFKSVSPLQETLDVMHC
jgi:hypothetical protein